MLRTLFSRIGKPSAGPPGAYAFNVPSFSAKGGVTIEKGGKKQTQAKSYERTGGMCPKCDGTGRVADIDLSEIYDEQKSLSEGAISVPGYTADGWMVKLYSESGLLDPDKPIKKYTKKELHNFLEHEQTKLKIAGVNRTYEGLLPRLRQSFFSKDRDSLQPHIRAFVERASTTGPCPACGGTRLAPGALKSKIKGRNIADLCSMQISELAQWVSELDEPSVAPLLASLSALLDSFVEIGLGYLSLDRPPGTLSGGEAQRTKMIRHLGSALTDVTYVFDEPTTGLHPHDIEQMNALLLQLRDKGNTVLVVEHKPETIAIADHVIDLGPGAGTHGGEITFSGSFAALKKSGTLTGKHLGHRAELKAAPREPVGQIEVRGASTNNLQNVDVDFPRGVLTVVTGVAGSGKSSLVHGSLAGRDGVVIVDQSPIAGSRRSSPATWTGLLEPVRKAFAKANKVKPALFSANSEGACPACGGAGVISTDLSFMETVETTCEECGGSRYDSSVLKYKLGGRNIVEVLDLPAEEALEFFGAAESSVPAAAKILQRFVDVGLGYLTMGQPLSTLSGGERQRLKLAAEMAEDGEVYVLDEPTTGLHPADIDQLLGLLDGLVDSGRTLIVITHHQALMAHADHVIDIGPGAGHEGGKVVFTGSPADLVKAAKKSLTGRHLASYLASN